MKIVDWQGGRAVPLCAGGAIVILFIDSGLSSSTSKVQGEPLLRKPKQNAAPSRKRPDGRRQLLIYLRPQLITELKQAALLDDEQRPAYVLAEEAIEQWLKNRKRK